MDKIKQKLQKFKPSILELEDQSHLHKSSNKKQTHFKLLLVSNYFLNKSKVQRQREVMNELKSEFHSGLHALSLRILDEKEYSEEASNHETIGCMNRKL